MNEVNSDLECLRDKSIFSQTMVELTWQEVQREAENNSIVIFPLSVVEEHGPHMDLSPDIYGANIYCKLIKMKLEEIGINSIIAPPYYWGINKASGRFPGSFTVKPETFKNILFELIECLIKWGFTRVFTFNIHGDLLHRNTIELALEEIRLKYKRDVYDLFNLSRKLNIEHKPFRIQRENRFSPDRHAGATETAFMQFYHPEKVDKDMAKRLKPQKSFDDELGYIGDPASYGLENEKEASVNIANHYVEVIKRFIGQ